MTDHLEAAARAALAKQPPTRCAECGSAPCICKSPDYAIGRLIQLQLEAVRHLDGAARELICMPGRDTKTARRALAAKMREQAQKVVLDLALILPDSQSAQDAAALYAPPQGTEAN